MNLPAEQPQALPAVMDSGTTSMAMMNDGALMDRMIKFAEIMASGKSTIPNELRNVGDCLAITMQAMAWRMMPQLVAQKVFFISGKIGYEAQLVSAAITNSGATKDNFHFDWFGPWGKVIGKFEIKKGEKGEYRIPGWKLADEEGIGIKVWATLRGEDEPRVLELLLAQARTRNSTLWADDPKQQLAYLAQKRWARLYTPGVILGVYTPDELEPQEREINPAPTATTKPADPEFYSDEEFQGRFPKWSAVIKKGKSSSDLVAWIETKGKSLTDKQKTALKAEEAIEGNAVEVPDESPSPGAPIATYSQVAEKLNAANSVDALDEAADLIGEIKNPDHRTELGLLYSTRRESFGE